MTWVGWLSLVIIAINVVVFIHFRKINREYNAYKAKD